MGILSVLLTEAYIRLGLIGLGAIPNVWHEVAIFSTVQGKYSFITKCSPSTLKESQTKVSTGELKMNNKKGGNAMKFTSQINNQYCESMSEPFPDSWSDSHPQQTAFTLLNKACCL